MQYIRFKHTAKLKKKQQSKLIILSKLTIGIMPLISLFTIEKSISNLLSKNISFPNSLYILATIFLIANTLLLVLFSMYSPLKSQRIKNKLKKIIEVNGFYYENKDDGTIFHSMIMKFYTIDEELYIEVYPDGAKYSDKMNDLTQVLQTALNLTVLSVQNDYANHSTYILKDTKENYIEINNWS